MISNHHSLPFQMKSTEIKSWFLSLDLCCVYTKYVWLRLSEKEQNMSFLVFADRQSVQFCLFFYCIFIFTPSRVSVDSHTPYGK